MASLSPQELATTECVWSESVKNYTNGLTLHPFNVAFFCFVVLYPKPKLLVKAGFCSVLQAVEKDMCGTVRMSYTDKLIYQ